MRQKCLPCTAMCHQCRYCTLARFSIWSYCNSSCAFRLLRNMSACKVELCCLRGVLDLASLGRTRMPTTGARAARERHPWRREATRLRKWVAESMTIIAQRRAGGRIRTSSPLNDNCTCFYRRHIVQEILVRQFLVRVRTLSPLRFVSSTTGNFLTSCNVRRYSVRYGPRTS